MHSLFSHASASPSAIFRVRFNESRKWHQSKAVPRGALNGEAGAPTRHIVESRSVVAPPRAEQSERCQRDSTGLLFRTPLVRSRAFPRCRSFLLLLSSCTTHSDAESPPLWRAARGSRQTVIAIPLPRSRTLRRYGTHTRRLLERRVISRRSPSAYKCGKRYKKKERERERICYVRHRWRRRCFPVKHGGAGNSGKSSNFA